MIHPLTVGSNFLGREHPVLDLQSGTRKQTVDLFLGRVLRGFRRTKVCPFLCVCVAFALSEERFYLPSFSRRVARIPLLYPRSLSFSHMKEKSQEKLIRIPHSREFHLHFREFHFHFIYFARLDPESVFIIL